MKLLLEKGAEVNNKDNFGRTPLSLATERGHSEITKLFFAKGDKPKVKTISLVNHRNPHLMKVQHSEAKQFLWFIVKEFGYAEIQK